jgi:hypothetical protein
MENTQKLVAENTHSLGEQVGGKTIYVVNGKAAFKALADSHGEKAAVMASIFASLDSIGELCAIALSPEPKEEGFALNFAFALQNIVNGICGLAHTHLCPEVPPHVIQEFVRKIDAAGTEVANANEEAKDTAKTHGLN